MNELNPDHYKYMPRQETTSPDEGNEIVSDEIQSNCVVETQEENKTEFSVETPADFNEEIVASPEQKHLISVPSPGVLAVKSLAQVIYGFCGPYIAPTLAAWAIFSLSILKVVVPGATMPYTLTVFGATCIVPFLVIYVLMRSRVVKSLQMFSLRERIIPYCIEILAMAAVALFFVFKGANTWIWGIFCGAGAATLANFLLNFRIRVSTHCTATAALLAVLIVIHNYGMPPVSLFWWVIGVVCALGFAGSMAIYVGRHSIWEVLAGYTTGFLGIILFSLLK